VNGFHVFFSFVTKNQLPILASDCQRRLGRCVIMRKNCDWPRRNTHRDTMRDDEMRYDDTKMRAINTIKMCRRLQRKSAHQRN
jgi:hypothetical protein